MTALPPELDEIAKLLRKEEPKVVFVVGAGVSNGATGLPQATWQGLLRHGIEHLRKIDYLTEAAEKKLLASIRDAFAPFVLSRALEHAESIESNLRLLSDTAYQEWLSSAFQNFKAKPDNSAVLAVIHELQQAGALVMTTNYDGLLENATGLDPVTWENHQAFNQVVNGDRKGVLHIHGHWQTPSSMVLGRSSYQRVLDAGDLQTVFRGLWLNWTWVYVGCGDGLDDENLGRLLEWGSKAFGASARTDYFLGVQATVDKLMAKPGRPVNLKVFGYQNHEDLPGVLQSISIAAGCAPFQPLVEDHPLFRHPKGDEMVPFPTRQEYVAGNVPALAADAIVQQRLEKHGWAFVMGKASVGKTTMALRLATAQPQCEYTVFYLDLAKHDPATQPERVLRRLLRPGTLVVLDNTHHEPELARELWDIWRTRPADSRLLVISTETQRLAISDSSQDQSFFIKHPENPGVDIVSTPEDMGRIVEYLYRRIAGSRAALPKPHTDALRILHDRYGSALGAFSLGALAHLDEFGKGNWDLPLSAAADWVRAKWLKNLDVQTLENLRCICVFGSQELELTVMREALPHPNSLDQLLELGLLQLTHGGKLRQHLHCSLREPSWGPMILEAGGTPVNQEALLHITAIRHWTAAAFLMQRYRMRRKAERMNRLAAAVAASPDAILSQLPDAWLNWVPGLIDGLYVSGQKDLATTLWHAITAAHDRVLARAWETPLGGLSSFIDRAKGQPELVAALWKGLNAEPAKLLARAWETPLQDLAAFIDRAKGQPELVAALWKGLNAEPAKLLARAWETPLDHLSTFLERAKGQSELVATLWKGLNAEPAKLLARAWESPLDHLSTFLERAKGQSELVAALWKGLNAEPAKLLARAWETPLYYLINFIERAKGQPDLVAALWKGLNAEPSKLLARAWETPLDHLSTFIERAKGQPELVAALWKGLNAEPSKLLARAWETPLNALGAFIERAIGQSELVAALWKGLNAEPSKLLAQAWETPLNALGAFIERAIDQSELVAALFEGLAAQPKRLGSIAGGLDCANLVGFLRQVPTPVALAALAPLKPDHWNGTPSDVPLSGAASLAGLCEVHGRVDLSEGIKKCLLLRANPKDHAMAGDFSGVTWLVTHVPIADQAMVPAFLNAVCTDRWLGQQFRFALSGVLSRGLRHLGGCASSAIMFKFEHQALGQRIFQDLRNFKTAEPTARSRTIQLIGCAALVDWWVPCEWLLPHSSQFLAELPRHHQPHPPDALYVQDLPYHLWLGLRVYAAITGRRVPVGVDLIEQTLSLWQGNLAHSSQNKEGVAHQLDASMIRWLERCRSNLRGDLLPDFEWVGDVCRRAKKS